MKYINLVSKTKKSSLLILFINITLNTPILMLFKPIKTYDLKSSKLYNINCIDN